MLSRAEDVRRVLVGPDARVESFSLSNQDVPGPAGQARWSVRLDTLHGGRQEGVQRITLDNGALQIVVLSTRGMSVYEVRRGDLRLGWDSPVREHVHPQFINLDSRGGLGWLEGFNEWLVRCGLEFAGHPGRDQFIDNTGAVAEMDLTVHGKIGNIPASQVEFIVDAAPPHRLRVRGVVHERLFFGPKLELVTEISAAPGEDTFRIEDRVTNHGASPQEFQLIYHANYGAPLLEQGARVVAPVKSIAPMNARAAEGIDDYASYAGPTPGFIEQVYLIEPFAGADGLSAVLLHNAAGDRGTSITWSTKELPYLTIWKNTAAAGDGYVTGLEPATGFPFNRRVERKFGRVPQLAAGATRSFTLEFGLHTGRASVQQWVNRVAQIAAGRKAQVAREPPKCRSDSRMNRR
jgi:hypothetical protein